MLHYRLVFNPQPLPGFQLEQVQSNLRRLLRLNDNQLRPLYTNPQAILKKGLEHSKAEAYRHKLAQYGVAVRIEPEFELALDPIETTAPEQTISKQSAATHANIKVEENTESGI